MPNDYQFKIARKGYDVNTCADRELVFSSEWPLLKLEKTGTATITADGQTICTHSLGYVPVVMLFSNLDYSATATVVAGSSFPLGHWNKITSTDVKFDSGASLPWPLTITVRYYVFRLDITTNFTAPSFELSDTVAGADGNYKFKLSKDGEDVSSTDYRDFVIHSDTRSPLIHMVKKTATDGVGTTWTFNHNLGYKPTFLAYVDYGTYWTYVSHNSSTFEISSSTSQMTIYWPFAGNVSTVIFKDPILVK